MVSTGIYRAPTLEERKDFADIGPYKKKDAKISFLTELSIKRAEMTKQKIPFFKKAAMDDFEEYYKEEVKKSRKKNGFVKVEDIKPIEMDWKKYSSPANIKLVEVAEQRDANISKKFPFDIFVKVYRYKYNGYGREGDYNISVMEDEQEAVARCKAQFDQVEYKRKSIAETISERYSKQK